MNFYYPQAKDFKKGIDPVILSGLHEGVVGDWDADEYLPTNTLQWSHTQIQQLPFPFDPLRPPPRDDFDYPYLTVYLWLRQRTTDHIDSGRSPVLAVSERPIGAYDWAPE
jgi:hypothetical protein